MIDQPKAKKNPPFILLVIAGVVILSIVCVFGSLAMDALGFLPTSTPTVVPTDTVPPTNTLPPEPTATPTPTNTPPPTFTPTPLPEPVILKGSGDSVIDFQKWDGPAILRIAHNGGGNFAVWSDDAGGNHIDLLVNTIGSYQGTLPLDFLDSEFTTRFEVSAGGAWEIQVIPLAQTRRENIPATFQGTGDDVIVLSGSASPDLLKADANNASANFAIWEYGNGRNLLINEIAPYTGTVPMDQDTILIVITATGPWSIEITTR